MNDLNLAGRIRLLCRRVVPDPLRSLLIARLGPDVTIGQDVDRARKDQGRSRVGPRVTWMRGGASTSHVLFCGHVYLSSVETPVNNMF